MKQTNETSVSLNKHISSTGICSRREADEWIKDGRVTINNQPAQSGNRVFEGDVVKINGKPIKTKPQTLYIAFNKPIGIVSTTDLKEPKNIIRYINHRERLFPVGRLDKDSQGLIFLTNDGDIVNKILRAGNNHEKEYIVTVKQRVTAAFMQKMSQGVRVLDTVTKPCKVTRLDDFTFKIILTQGLNRQIRRMCEYLLYDVTKLNRIRIMNVKLEGLKVGQWRKLSRTEMEQINKMIAHSSKTEEASKDERKKENSSKRKFALPKKGFGSR